MKSIQSSQNPSYKEWKKLLKRKGREKAGLYLVEGPHLVSEALKETGMVSALILDENFESEAFQVDFPVFQLTEPLFRELCATETPQGVIAVCKMPKTQIPEEAKRLLLIDAVQDPGNLGTLIRTADAAGMDGIILGTGTVDPYNDKVLRSAQGSHFHIPIVQQSLKEVIFELKEKNIPIVGTALNGKVLGSDSDIQGSEAFALIVGNEGEGVRPEVLQMTDINIKIPMYGRAESLNVAVAAGILMYYLRLK
ncbi:MAG: TrmH family RNA methyltransferase [Tuberibacillus sp.]